MNELHQELQEALTLLFEDPEDAKNAADLLAQTEDKETLTLFTQLLADAKEELLAKISAHKKHIAEIQSLVRELSQLKKDIDTDAFLITLAKRLQ